MCVLILTELLAGKECRQRGKVKPCMSFEINCQRICLSHVIIRLIVEFQFQVEFFWITEIKRKVFANNLP